VLVVRESRWSRIRLTGITGQRPEIGGDYGNPIVKLRSMQVRVTTRKLRPGYRPAAVVPVIRVEECTVLHLGKPKVHALRGVNLRSAGEGSGQSWVQRQRQVHVRTAGCLDCRHGNTRLRVCGMSPVWTKKHGGHTQSQAGIVFQGFNLLAPHHALENVELPTLWPSWIEKT